TFQDAILITRALGLQYTWIDALCILQDSEDDWRYESALMSKIYGHGSVNLSAWASHNGHGGLIRQSNRRFSSSIVVKATWTGPTSGTYRLRRDDHGLDFASIFRQAPLASRAWAFQERILSPV